jgi:hypothetical protein
MNRITAPKMNQISSPGPLSPDAPGPDLEAAILRLSHTNVLVVGDVMLDRYVYGDVTRISVEAPVPILAIDRAWRRRRVHHRGWRR